MGLGYYARLVKKKHRKFRGEQAFKFYTNELMLK